jgi:hypothetical protein
MTTDHHPRLFADDAAIQRIGEALIARTLPRAEWTHEAHLAASLWIVRDRLDIAPERDIPGIIRRYNESVGGVNDDYQGYHQTITQTYIAAIRAHLSDTPTASALVEAVNALLVSPRGRRDWPLTLYSHARLFIVEARRGWLEPDIQSSICAGTVPPVTDNARITALCRRMFMSALPSSGPS